MTVILEAVVMCFVLLIICVIGMANGPEGMVFFYEKEVQERAVQLGLTTEEKIRKRKTITFFALMIPQFLLVPYMVYGINGAKDAGTAAFQMIVIYLISGLFDRLFIDWYWVGKTKAWIIPGTEDLRPYIPAKVLVRKWIGTLVVYPLMALLMAKIMTFIV